MQEPAPLIAAPVTSDVQGKIDRLAGAAWGAHEDIGGAPLELDSDELPPFEVSATVRAMLQHVRRVAPRLEVPWLVPRVRVEPISEAAGQFVEEDGWVTIAVSSAFVSKPLAATAILCHELCHYVLNANGIREPTTSDNERLTDAAMFVFGLGSTFLKGYQQRSTREYRSGHRLGYLTDAEYDFAARYARRLRLAPNQSPTRDDEADRRLRSVVFDSASRASLLASYRKKHPLATPAAIVEKILDDIARDNR